MTIPPQLEKKGGERNGYRNQGSVQVFEARLDQEEVIVGNGERRFLFPHYLIKKEKNYESNTLLYLRPGIY